MGAVPTPAQRWAAGVEYDGSRYHGWQFQGAPVASLQEELEKALSKVADHRLTTTAAGRTDARVHAYQQVVHFESPSLRDAHAWHMGCNSLLPRDIALTWVRRVPGSFDARRSAVARRYRYVIQNRRSRPGVSSGKVAWVVAPLDAALMHAGAQLLVGEHDFSALRDSDCQSKSPVRRVGSITVGRSHEFVTIDIEANAFLHHMVRNIAGTLIPVGRGLQSPAWVAEVLASRDRAQAGVTAEAAGLYFVGPCYPDSYGLPPPPAPSFPGPI